MARLSHAYGRCPKCELILPLCDLAGETDVSLRMREQGGGARCGVCKCVFDASEQWPLEFRHACIDCSAVIRAPADAAIVACPGCDAYFFNPNNPPAVRQRAEAMLAKQARIAAMVQQLDELLAEAERRLGSFGRWGGAGGLGAFPEDRSGVSRAPFEDREARRSVQGVPPSPRQRIEVPEEWIDRSRAIPEVFRDAFTLAARTFGTPRDRLVLELRYGLDGNPSRTFRQIGEALNRSASRAQSILSHAQSILRLTAQPPIDGSVPAYRACAVAVYLATKVIGDPNDPHAPARIRYFVDQALPGVQPKVATSLLINIADTGYELHSWGRDQALCRAVAAVRPD